METFKRHIALRDMEIVGTVNWRELDLDCIEISSRCMKLGGDKKVLSGMLRNEKTKLPETPEERFYALEKRMTELELQLQARPEGASVVVSINGEELIKKYFTELDKRASESRKRFNEYKEQLMTREQIGS